MTGAAALSASDSAVDVVSAAGAGAAGAGAAGAGDEGGDSSPASSSSALFSFSLEILPLRSFDRLF